MIEVNSPIDEAEFARLREALSGMDEQQQLALGRRVSELGRCALAYLQEVRMFSGATDITDEEKAEVNRLEVEQAFMRRLLRLIPLE